MLLRTASVPLASFVVSFAVLAAQTGPAIFPTRVYESGGERPSALALADLDRDGRLDVVVANRATNSVAVLRGDAWGGLGTPLAYPVAGQAPAALAIGDLDGDGFLDVLTANEEDATVSLLRGDARGTLEPAVTFATCGSKLAGIALGDVNGDGRIDVVVVCSVTANLCVLAGNARGGLDPPVSYETGGSYPTALALADVDLDGRVDVVVVNAGSGTIGVLRQTRDGRLAPAEVHASGGDRPVSVAVGELTGDGRPDIAVANSYSASIGVLAGNAQGSFDPPALVGLNLPTFVAIDDVDGDGRADLVVTCAQISEVDVLRGTGTGGFSAPERASTGGSHPVAVATGDVTGDGRKDLVCANEGSSRIGVVSGRSRGFDAAIPIAANLQWPGSVVIADATQDGIPDVLVGEGLEGPMQVALLVGAGDGTFRPPVEILNAIPVMQPQAMRFADVTGDGHPDIVTVDPVYGVVAVIPADGRGGFEPPRTYPDTAEVAPYCVAVGDVTGDGRADVVVGGLHGSVGVLPGNPQGTLDPMRTYASGSSSVGDVALADVDGDGHLDVIAALRDTGTIALLRGNARGTLDAPIAFDAGGTGSHFLRIGDVTGDGIPDLVVANEGREPISVLAGSRSGRFARPVTYAIGAGDPASFAIGDVDGDGRLDLVVAARESGDGDRLCVLRGNAEGTFDPPEAYAGCGVYAYTDSVALGDLDGDGRLDAVVANGESRVTLCRNRLPTLAGQATCFGDGSQGPCPCSNDGASGRGCDNSQATGGALLASSGESRVTRDRVVLTVTGVVDATLCLFVQGTAEVPIASFGEGLLCTGGVSTRLFVKVSTNGVASAPGPNDPSITTRSASLGEPLLPGDVRVYQVVYRDPSVAFCARPSFDVSRGWLLAWQE